MTRGAMIVDIPTQIGAIERRSAARRARTAVRT